MSFFSFPVLFFNCPCFFFNFRTTVPTIVEIPVNPKFRGLRKISKILFSADNFFKMVVCVTVTFGTSHVTDSST